MSTYTLRLSRITPRRFASALALAGLLAVPVAADAADPVLDWNAIAVSTMVTQAPPPSPFAQARLMAITQLAVFDAVNAITRQYEPYLGTVTGSSWASPDAAAVAAAHKVLTTYFGGNPATLAALNAARMTSLAAMTPGAAKERGIEIGEAAANAMLASRAADGSAPLTIYMPSTTLAGDWQLTPGCAAGAFYNWRNVTPFGVGDVRDYLLPPPPSLTSREYTKAYDEVKAVGDLNSTQRPQDRTDVARFYAATSPALLLNSAARQMAAAKGHTLSENARNLALLNMASSDSLVASFATKYEYNFWRPVTAIRAGDDDGNPDTQGDTGFSPLISTPCFPSYGSNHAAGSYSGAEILRRVYGAAGHSLTIVNPFAAAPVSGMVMRYSQLKDLCQDIDDARIYGGIHFRFDQEASARLGREVAADVYKNNLRKRMGNEQ
jgi:hypothetical protein